MKRKDIEGNSRGLF